MGVTLKLATSLDGRIATASGESRWITGDEARSVVHGLRAHHDAVVIGIETALADDPELTVRDPRYRGRQPARVVFDSKCRLPVTSKLAQTAHEIPTYVISTSPLRDELRALGVRGWQLEPDAAGHPEPANALGFLDVDDLNTFLVEGGGQVAASFVRAGLVDGIEWFRAPILLGSEGRPCLGALDLAKLAEAPRFRRVSTQALGSDLWERYERA